MKLRKSMQQSERVCAAADEFWYKNVFFNFFFVANEHNDDDDGSFDPSACSVTIIAMKEGIASNNKNNLLKLTRRPKFNCFIVHRRKKKIIYFFFCLEKRNWLSIVLSLFFWPKHNRPNFMISKQTCFQSFLNSFASNVKHILTSFVFTFRKTIIVILKCWSESFWDIPQKWDLGRVLKFDCLSIGTKR